MRRRAFLGAAGAAMLAPAEVFGVPQAGSRRPEAALEKLGAIALTEARRLKAAYCDIRICRYREQSLFLRLSPERGTGKTIEAPSVNESQSYGFGIRVIAEGAWGFAASPLVSPDEIRRITREAVLVAQGNAQLKGAALRLAPVKAYNDRWTCLFERDPFEVPLEEKIETLRAAATEMKKGKSVFIASGALIFRSEEKYFASSEGSSIQQFLVQTYPSLTATGVDAKQGITRSRNYRPGPLQVGYEWVAKVNLLENARRIREEVAEQLAAPPVKPGRKDLVLLPSHLFLTIHESIGHSTELDRALGYEANFAGTSFLTPGKLGKERIGSDIVNFYGDRTRPQSLATAGYDDDGVKTVQFPIVQKGIFTGYQTIRDQAHLVNEKESRACCYADSWASVPFQRMPNVWLAPGPDNVTLDDLIGGVDDGILIDGRGSYSIDQQRYNFQFGGDAFWEIKGGKKRGMLSRVAYQSRTPDFWQACDGIAGRGWWEQYGSGADGKGEPIQLNAVSHGCSPARFRQINIIVTD